MLNFMQVWLDKNLSAICRLSISVSPSSELRSASPLKGEAVTCVSLAHFTASPLRGEAARRADEGGKKNKINKPSVLLYN